MSEKANENVNYVQKQKYIINSTHIGITAYDKIFNEEKQKNYFMKKIIGYISAQDPFTDRRAWSGTIYKIREAIEVSGYEVRWIPYKENSWREILVKILCKLYSVVSSKNIMLGVHSEYIARLYAKSIRKDRYFEECDYLFFSGGAQIALYMSTDKPIIYYTDATFHIMEDYYFCNLLENAKIKSERLEELATNKASINIRSSQWAADSVVRDCHANPQTSYVLEFGPNLDLKDLHPCLPYNNGVLNILFSGVEWKRKGGDIAVNTVEYLNLRGIKSHIYIAGIEKLPKHYRNLPFVTHVGFLNKNLPQQYQQYIELWQTCHILLLPTRAECSGIVFCEASAFGIPVYTYDTGGIGNYVVNGVNGHRLPLSAVAEDFAQKIEDDIRMKRICDLHQGALKLSKERLSWECWADKFKKIVNKHFKE